MSTVEKAVSLLELFSAAQPEVGLSDLARRSGFDKATTRRLLVSLAGRGIVEQDATSRRYRLGAGLSRLARIRDTHFPFVPVAAPLVRELAEETSETVHLSEFGAGSLLTVFVALSPRANRVNVDVGQILPLHGTASGLAFLAFSRPETLTAYVEHPLATFTAYTVTQRDRITEAVKAAAECGYSRSAQGYEEGVHSVAAPILGADGYAIGTLAVASPVSRVDDTLAVIQGEAAKRTGTRISALLNGDAVEVLQGRS